MPDTFHQSRHGGSRTTHPGRRLAGAALAVVVLTGVSACGGSDPEQSATDDTLVIQSSSGTQESEGHGGTTFGYEGTDGPENWGQLDPAWATCADGSAQSPIDIVNPAPADLANPIMQYVSGPATVINNGHTIEAEAQPASSITLDGTTYPFAQMHFHAPSEHTVAGKPAAAELHFVNKTADGKIAVVAVLLQQGDTANAALQPYISAASVEEGQDKEVDLDFPAMLPSGPTIRYSGSLTTPPCTQGVSWLVMQAPITVSGDQLAALTAAYDGNARPVQPLDDRPVQIDSTP